MKHRSHPRNWVPAILALILTVSCLASSSEAKQAPAGVPYTVEIQGAPENLPNVLELLREISSAVQNSEKPPPTLELLRRRAVEDLPEMKKVLRSFGFFKGVVKVDIPAPETGYLPDPENVQAGPDTHPPQSRPVTVRFQIHPGPRFGFSQPTITLAGGTDANTLAPPTPTETGILDHSPYTAKAVVEAGQYILKYYQSNGYPFPQIANREVVADFKTNSVKVQFNVAPGRQARFGETRIKGLDRLEPRYVYELLPWKKGEPYDIRSIDKARRTLFDTNLFSLVEFNNPGEVDAQGSLPITVQLKERAPRTIRLGVEYTTDYGPGVNGSWTHRNLFGMAERLTAGAVFNSKIRTAFAQFNKPMFLAKNNTFVGQSAFNDETTDAYDARSIDTSTILKRKFTSTFWAGGGLGFRYGRAKQETGNQYSTYHLAYIPFTATQDTRKDLLNPTQGYELSLTLAPYQDVGNSDLRFFRYLLSGSTYYNFNSGDKIVGAVRATFGQNFGVSHDDMPADLRFYAGGGGSVRGYAYQLAGPLQGDVPLGGLSVLTFSLELRFKVTDTIGLVPFLDGGTAFLNTTPDFSRQDLLYGAGLGIRYYTAIGPIRLDVAVPLKKRPVDDSFQLYVSIGQSF